MVDIYVLHVFLTVVGDVCMCIYITITIYCIILQSPHQSVTLGRPGEILNMFRNKHLKQKLKKKCPPTVQWNAIRGEKPVGYPRIKTERLCNVCYGL